MPATGLDIDEFLEKVGQYRNKGLSDGEVAAALGVGVRKLYARLKTAGLSLKDFPKGIPTSSRVRSADAPYEELKKDRKRTFRRKKNHEDDLASLTISLPIEGPYGIVFLGDPHVDDDGCDWDTLDQHIAIIRETDGLYAINLGDTTNNWVGRLERLYANQRTTAKEAQILAAGFIKDLTGKWLFHVGGNHDLWSGHNDPLPGLCEAAKATYIPIGGKIGIRQGKNLLYINARHTFPGNSMWNTAHGPARSVLMGNTEHVAVCGHKHTTGQNIIKAPNGRICHALQVSSYKVIDEYAKEGGFRDNTISPACMVVVDHRYQETDPAMIQVFHSIERGAEFMKFLRGEYAAKKKA